MDNAEGDSGPCPAEPLVVAPAGCAAMHVAAILCKKRQAFTRCKLRVSAEQRDDPLPHVFERVRITHVVDGPVEIEAVPPCDRTVGDEVLHGHRQPGFGRC